MADVSSTLRNRWKFGASPAGGEVVHGGPARPNQLVEVQRGFFLRKHWPTGFTMLDGSEPKFGRLPVHDGARWHPRWQATGAWTTVPNVQNVQLKWTLPVDAKSASSATKSLTCLVDNVVFKQIIGPLGAYSLIQRGYLAPWLGVAVMGRPHVQQSNEWLDVFNGGYAIRVKQGYGDELATVFWGIIDECDFQSSPDQLTITARQDSVLTDSRVFANNKEPALRSPIFFADRRWADDVKPVAAGAAASSHAAGHDAIELTRDGGGYWSSAAQGAQDWTEWFEFHIPQGRYEEIYVEPRHAGMEMYVSAYVRGTNRPTRCKYNDRPLDVPTGGMWLDIGMGDVPGAQGGYPFIKHNGSVDARGRKHRIGKLECGDNTVLRVAFRRLHGEADGRYSAQVNRAMTYSRKERKSVQRTNQYILVDDVADVIRFVLMWAGYKEWVIEDTGVSLRLPMSFDQSSFYVDIIDWVLRQLDYVFYVNDPTSDAASIGVPTFVHGGYSDHPGQQLEQITSADVVTGDQGKYNAADLPVNIRYRGTIDKRGYSDVEERARRFEYLYRPPWSSQRQGAHVDRTSGILRHEVNTDPNLLSTTQCAVACVLLAVNYALATFTASVQTPGYPGAEVNKQVAVIDKPSGINSRIWVTDLQTEWKMTEKATTYVTTWTGPLLDTLDMQQLLDDLADVIHRRTYEP